MRELHFSIARMLQPDSIVPSAANPQTLNRYSYALSNPARYVDPSGFYTVDCAQNSKCEEEKTRFERARQHNLASKDDQIKATASAYGDLGEKNGVTVSFVDPGNHKGGDTKPELEANGNGGVRVTAIVRMKPGLSGSELDAAVGHEGQHIVDANVFAATVDLAKNPGGDKSKNLTHYHLEQRAYGVTDKILKNGNTNLPLGPRGVSLGARGSMQVSGAIDKILAAPLPNGYELSPKNQGPNQFADSPGEND